jgi:branched-chain amino acid transport system ATP-binding protein
MTILKTENITMRFGGVTAVDNFNMHVEEGEIVSVIGPNGAGKTTTFNMITGVYAPTEGNILFNDNNGHMLDITNKRPDIITGLGIARTFQNIRLFSEMSVIDNILVAQHLHVKSGMLGAIAYWPNYWKEEKKMRDRANILLEKVGLLEYSNEKSTALPYGLQRRLEIARALATQPRLILLDEPAAGMNPTETEELTKFVLDIKNEFDLTVIMIEHHMQIVMDISDRIYVLDFGKNIAHGVPKEIQNNPCVIDAYLGVADDVED